MRHYLLTRSAFGPEVNARERRQRLDLLARVTVPSIRAQDYRDFTWIVLVNLDDPSLEERRAILAGADIPTVIASAEKMVVRGGPDAPWGPWSKHITWDQATITTRLDDDDALAPWMLGAVRARAEEWGRNHPRKPSVWSFPAGYRVIGTQVERVLYTVPMFCTYHAPLGVRGTIYDVGHLSAAKLAPIREINQRPAWLWVRHDLTRSHTNMRRGLSMARRDIEELTPEIRAEFPAVDWDFIAALPQRGPAEPDKDRPTGRPIYDPRSAHVRRA